MEMSVFKSKEIYNVFIGDEFTVTVEVERDRMTITKITQWVIDEYDIEYEYYAKVKYTKKIIDIHNLENEMRIFINSRFDKMIEKLEEIKVRLSEY